MNLDDVIIQGCKDNKRKEQKMLLEKYAPYLMSIALRYLNNSDMAKDVVQETWIKVFKNINQYKEGTNLKAWLAKITVNTAIKTKRKTPMVMTSDCIESEQLISKIINADEQLAYEDLLKIVSKVGSPAKDVFMMYVLDGMSHKEIGVVLNITESTSRVHLTNARKNLRNMITLVKTERA